MDDALVVCRLQCIADLQHDVASRREPDAALHVDALRQRLPFEILHHEIGHAFADETEVGDVHDVGVADERGGAGFLHEALHDRGTPGELVAEHLDRDGLADRRVLGDEHGAHAALADAVDDPIAIAEQIAAGDRWGRRAGTLPALAVDGRRHRSAFGPRRRDFRPAIAAPRHRGDDTSPIVAAPRRRLRVRLRRPTCTMSRP